MPGPSRQRGFDPAAGLSWELLWQDVPRIGSGLVAVLKMLVRRELWVAEAAGGRRPGPAGGETA